MNGTANEITVLTVGSVTRERMRRLSRPTTQPTTPAIATDLRKSPATSPAVVVTSVSTVMATAERNRASAVASFSRLSPCRIEVIRGDTPTSRTIEVATASVGLTIAPSAIPAASGSPGTRAWNRNPSATALTTTRATESPEMVRRSRRKSMVGICTAAE